MRNDQTRPAPPPLRPEELRAVPCKTCGEDLRRTETFIRILQHRLDPSRRGPEPVSLMYCAGCGAQLTIAGDPVPQDHKDYRPLEKSQ